MTTPRFPHLAAYGALLAATMMWGSNGTVARSLGDIIPGFSLSVLRWVIVLVLLLPFVWSERHAIARALRHQTGAMVSFGLLGGALQSGLIYTGLVDSTAIHLGLFNSAIPVMIMLVSWFWHRRPAQRLEVIGLVISLSGVLLIIAHGDLNALLRLDFGYGDLLMLAGMITWAFYTIQLAHRPESLSLLAFVFVVALVGSLLTLPLVALEFAHYGVPQMQPRHWAAMFYIAAFPTLAATLCFSFGVTRVGSMRAGIFAHFMPVFATVFAVVFLGEVFHAYHGVGFVLVAGGAIMSCFRPDAVVTSAPPGRSSNPDRST